MTSWSGSTTSARATSPSPRISPSGNRRFPNRTRNRRTSPSKDRDDVPGFRRRWLWQSWVNARFKEATDTEQKGGEDEFKVALGPRSQPEEYQCERHMVDRGGGRGRADRTAMAVDVPGAINRVKRDHRLCYAPVSSGACRPVGPAYRRWSGAAVRRARMDDPLAGDACA